MKQLTETIFWNELKRQASNIRLLTGTELQELTRLHGSQYLKQIAGITFDYSRQRVTEAIVDLLIQLADEARLAERIDCLMSGSKVNVSENKAALHTALRDLTNSPVYVDGLNIMNEVMDTKEQIKLIADSVRNKHWLGHTGKPITDVVNIGMGGSDLGPRLCINALASLSIASINFHFISDVDPDSFHHVVARINPETTLFIVSSKSFTTKETLLNAAKAMKLYPIEQAIEHHFIAVTAHPAKALKMGIKTVLPIWEWVGGRYSFCSAVNLITAIAIGYEYFSELLAGAHDVDKHVRNTDFKENVPVLMGLLGVWNNNFLNIHNLLILAYSKRLEYFIPYVQQLDMESNGKSIDVSGRVVNYATGPIVWGGLGNQAQHSYLQLLCQGTHHCAADFITLQTHDNHILNAMSDYKMKVLSEGIDSIENPNGYISGKMPLSHIRLSNCSPYSLGALVALYEHKVFVQSVIWNINPFDQPGVESAKSVSDIFSLLN
ncbi:glucose-6-phosphate isomerase [Legionella worsleiensis]|uniref:Glucose-6-phosphate isomerase n=1 Tax=Legionella worsleiensis TaxID=45076 RepID=A0A0W1A3E5_9GAMM|nr:glucose-6-phosphate isomerase [Legionella worsleiensis]KTD75861.1 glucose-6-phosphate isomerase [Legionella worsleiensis]STY32874.1 glucose-6-phosphate isomerase [Legionella worsleiensis]